MPPGRESWQGLVFFRHDEVMALSSPFRVPPMQPYQHQHNANDDFNRDHLAISATYVL